MANIQEQFEEEVKKMKNLEKDKEKYLNSRQELEMKLSESTNVKEELDLMEDDSKIFKLIGAVLVKQDLNEAKSTVEKRLDFINAEIKRIEANIADCTAQSKSQQDKLIALQKAFQAQQQK